MFYFLYFAQVALNKIPAWFSIFSAYFYPREAKLYWNTKSQQSSGSNSGTLSHRILKIFIITTNSIASAAIMGLLHSAMVKV